MCFFLNADHMSPLSIVHQHLDEWAQKGKFDLHQVGQKWRGKLGS